MSNSSLASQISVMSFNIRYDNPKDGINAWAFRKEALVKLLNRYQPDFLGVQEALIHQVAFIQENTHYQYIGVGRDNAKEAGEFSAIFYDAAKFELISENTFWLSETLHTVSKGWDAVLPRICSYGKFRNREKQEEIYIFNTHFDHIGQKAREMSARLILEQMRSLDFEQSKMVLMGDFNTIAQSKPLAILSKHLQESSQVAQQKPENLKGTFNGFQNNSKLSLRIDYIFTHNLTVLSYKHLEDKREDNLWISDHLPVWIEVS